MERNEELQKAAENYASQMCNDCFARRHCEWKNEKCIEYEAKENGFADGVKWADEHPKSIGQPKNIWHHANEEPQGTDWRIICQDEEGKFWIIDWADVILLYNTWNTHVTIEKLVKWAYIDELIKE